MRKLTILAVLLGAVGLAFAQARTFPPSGTTGVAGSSGPLSDEADAINPRWANLVAGWKLDETSDGSAPVTRYDVLGSIDLTDTNDTPSAAGLIGNAADFSVADVNYLSHAAFASPAAWTVSLWFKRPAGGVADESLFSRHNTWPSQVNCTIYRREVDLSGNLVALVGDGAAFVSVTISASQTADVWHHVIAWYDPADKIVRGVIDNGAVQASTALTGTLYVADTPLKIGFNADIGGTDSNVDEAYLFSTVIGGDSAWRTGMYNSGAGRSYPN
jgi:hypothetical protein